MISYMFPYKPLPDIPMINIPSVQKSISSMIPGGLFECAADQYLLTPPIDPQDEEFHKAAESRGQLYPLDVDINLRRRSKTPVLQASVNNTS